MAYVDPYAGSPYAPQPPQAYMPQHGGGPPPMGTAIPAPRPDGRCMFFAIFSAMFFFRHFFPPVRIKIHEKQFISIGYNISFNFQIFSGRLPHNI